MQTRRPRLSPARAWRVSAILPASLTLAIALLAALAWIDRGSLPSLLLRLLSAAAGTPPPSDPCIGAPIPC
jgi:hypothetical protein